MCDCRGTKLVHNSAVCAQSERDRHFLALSLLRLLLWYEFSIRLGTLCDIVYAMYRILKDSLMENLYKVPVMAITQNNDYY